MGASSHSCGHICARTQMKARGRREVTSGVNKNIEAIQLWHRAETGADAFQILSQVAYYGNWSCSGPEIRQASKPLHFDLVLDC